MGSVTVTGEIAEFTARANIAVVADDQLLAQFTIEDLRCCLLMAVVQEGYRAVVTDEEGREHEGTVAVVNRKALAIGVLIPCQPQGGAS